jgi:hypothetical protein
MSLRRVVGEERRLLLAGLVEGYGFDAEALEGYETLEYEEGVWVVSPAVIGLPLRKLRVESVGILLVRESTPTVAALQLFARPKGDAITLSEADASAFIDRKTVAVEARDGVHVAFHGGVALDLGYAKAGRLTRVKAAKD